MVKPEIKPKYYGSENKKYKMDIKLTPTPKSCTECPFYHMPHPEDQGSYDEHWDCYFTPIYDYFGIAVSRYANCPLKT